MTITSNNWKLEGTDLLEVPQGYYGFVYKIVNNVTKREYIGKKLFFSQKTKQVGGKKKKYKTESDWKSYYGSNEELLKDVKELGESNFDRYILHLCRTKGECSYYEAKSQFVLDVLLNPKNYYNTWIMCKIHRKHLPSVDIGKV